MRLSTIKVQLQLECFQWMKMCILHEIVAINQHTANQHTAFKVFFSVLVILTGYRLNLLLASFLPSLTYEQYYQSKKDVRVHI